MNNFLNNLLGRHPDRIKARVEIYTWQTCPYCIRAKMLLSWKGVKFTEYKIDGDGAARAKMAERANGGRSVPQILININRLVAVMICISLIAREPSINY